MISVFMKHEKNPRTVICAYHIVYELVASSRWQKTENKTVFSVTQSFPDSP